MRAASPAATRSSSGRPTRSRGDHAQTLDESSYNFQPHPFIRNWGALMGEDHPITWCQKYDGGRVWYTGLGHDANIYANHDSMAMIVQGVMWAAGKWGLRGCDVVG
jgi:type 1 glutamine amidotransferase